MVRINHVDRHLDDMERIADEFAHIGYEAGLAGFVLFGKDKQFFGFLLEFAFNDSYGE